MKKTIVSLIMLLFALGLGVAPATRAASEIDQSSTTGAGSLRIATGARMAQTFRPAYSVLDKVEIEITGAVGGSTLDVHLSELQGEGWNALTTITGQTVTDGWNTFDFTNQNLTVGGRYAIFVYDYTDSPRNTSMWKYATGNPYDRGYAIWQTTDKEDWDFNFRTYTVADDPEGNPAPAGDNNSSNTGNTTSDASTAPITTTSASIKAPSGLTGKYDSGVVLTWTKSATSTIDGYHVYRSTQKTTGFTRVGTVDSSKTTYTDITTTADTTYHYYVRAYSNVGESVSSNTVSIKTTTGAVAETVKRSLIASYLEEEDGGFNWFNFCLISCGGILLLALVIYEVWRWRKTGRFLNHHKEVAKVAAPTTSTPPETPPTK